MHLVSGPGSMGHTFIQDQTHPLVVPWCSHCGLSLKVWTDQQTPCPGPPAEQAEAPTTEAVDLMAEDLDRGERLALMVAAEFALLQQETEAARAIAVTLEQDAAEARRHLRGLVDVLERVGTTWAHDDAALSAASEFLNAPPALD